MGNCHKHRSLVSLTHSKCTQKVPAHACSVQMQKNVAQMLATLGFPGGSDSKASACNVGRPGFHPWVGKFPWRRKWQPALRLLPGKFHGRRSLVGYSPWGHRESDVTEQLHFWMLAGGQVQAGEAGGRCGKPSTGPR